MNSNDLNSTNRFSDRVSDYDLYRPSYPDTLLAYLDERIGLRGSRVADIGAGTGIFTKLLMERGATVDAVEPNSEMGNAALRNLADKPGFHFSSGTAEKTDLPASSVNLITCAQAFHWFDAKKTRIEFDRILKRDGKIALIWNDTEKARGLGRAYEEIKTRFGGEDYEKMSSVYADVDALLPDFFKAKRFDAQVFSNFQLLDEAGLIGRFFSSSYAPKLNSPGADEARVALATLFQRFANDARVRLEYKTELFLGD